MSSLSIATEKVVAWECELERLRHVQMLKQLVPQAEVGWMDRSSPDNDQLLSDNDAAFAKGILHFMRASSARQQRT